MKNLVGIHVHVNKHPGSRNYSEHVLMLQILSAVLWKNHNGPIHLYTTEEDLKFFREMGMDIFYDHIDTEVLKDDSIPWNHFYPAAKMKVLSTLKEFPVAFIDTDFLYKQSLDVDPSSYDIIYVHKEGRFWRNYPSLDYLGIRPGYEFPQIPELETCKPINVGFFVINSEKLAKEYTELALDYMRGNDVECKFVDWATEGLRIFWKSLFVEQRLLSAIVDHGNYTQHQLFPFDYYGDTLTWKREDQILSQMTINTQYSPPFYHLWGEKSLYSYDWGQPMRIFNFYSIAEHFRHANLEYVQNAFFSILHYAAEKTSNEEGTDVYKLKKYIKILSE